MSVHVRLDGFDALREGLRSLPDDLATSASSVVRETAETTGQEIVTNYPDRSGNLRRGVSVNVSVNSRAAVRATVVSGSPHAHLYEFGTGARQTKTGANRGAMPKGPDDSRVIPRAIRARQRMTDRLIAIVREAGLAVQA